ncbi:MAG: hypothetical protein KC478_14460 [Bacteriovoracaceae bacterium]|nr:hypothetical protein [Bacteriovoracaceae bacterium]
MKSLLCLFLIALNCFAASKTQISIPKSMCSDTDIRTKMDPSMKEHFTKPRSQGSIGWCYGFVAADLMSAEVGEALSSIHTSSIYNQSVEDSVITKLAYDIFQPSAFKDIYEGGFIEEAIEEVAKNKVVCIESKLPFNANYGVTTKNLILMMEKLKENSEASNQVFDQKACYEAQAIIKLGKFDILPKDLHKVLVNQNLNHALSDLAKKHCSGDLVKVPKFSVKTKSRPSYPRRLRRDPEKAAKKHSRSIGKYFKAINSQLEKGKPIGIDYNVKHITRQDGMHSSVVTARRWNNGRCEFKVRNSWGKTCATYKPDEVSSCNYWEGSYWITDQKFYEMVNRITYIDS